MNENAEQLILNAWHTLSDAQDIRDDALLAPNAATLVDAANFLFERRVEYPCLAKIRARYLGLAANYALDNGRLRVAADMFKQLSDCYAPATRENFLNLERAGECKFILGNMEEAAALFSLGASYAGEAGDEEARHSIEIRLGGAIARTGQAHEAIEMLTRTDEAVNHPDFKNLQPRARLALATAHMIVGNVATARALSQQARQLSTTYHDTDVAIAAANVYAGTLAVGGEHAAACNVLRCAADTARATGKKRLLSRVLGNLGVTLLEAGEITAGRTALQQAQDLHQILGDENIHAHTCLNIGAAYCEEGRPAKAIPYMLRSRDEFERQGDRVSAAKAGLDAALCLTTLNRLDEAAELVDKLRDTGELAELEVSSAWYEAAGALELARRNFDAAYTLYSQLLEVSRAAGMRVYVARAALGCATVSISRREYREALELATEAANALNRPGQVPQLDLVEALILGVRASRELGDHKASTQRLRMALEHADELPLLANPQCPRAERMLTTLQHLEATAVA